LVGHGVEDAPAGVELAHLRVDLLGRPLQEKLTKHARGAFLRRDRDAGARPGEAAGAGVDAKSQRGEASEVADALRDELVQRDGVAKRAAGRMRRGGEEGNVGGVAAIHVGMRHAAHDREVIAMVFEKLEVWREGVILACLPWEELAVQQAQVVADAQEPAWRPAWGGIGGEGFAAEWRDHALKERQRQCNSRHAEETPARNGPAAGDERAMGPGGSCCVHAVTWSGTIGSGSTLQ
jgi:hypothetical protein